MKVWCLYEVEHDFASPPQLTLWGQYASLAKAQAGAKGNRWLYLAKEELESADRRWLIRAEEVEE